MTVLLVSVYTCINLNSDAPVVGALLGDVGRYLLAAGLVVATRGLAAGTATTSQVAWVLVASAVVGAVFARLTLYLHGRDR